jgi:DNA-binding LytR/AlgR family response regulator
MQRLTPYANNLSVTIRHLFTFGVLFCFFGTSAQHTKQFADFTTQIDQLVTQNDTTGVTEVFRYGRNWALEHGIPQTNPDFLSFQLNEIRYFLKFSKIPIDSAIVRYDRVLNYAIAAENHLVQAKTLGYLAGAYRSKRELGKAFEYNQKEITSARLTSDKRLLGRAYITELDIAYNSLPSPMQTEDLNKLIAKGEYAIHFSEENNLPDILPFAKLYLSKFYVKQGDFDHGRNILLSISDEEPLAVTFSKYEQLCHIAQQTGDLENYRDYSLEFKKRAYKTKRTFVALNVHNYLLDYALTVKNKDSASHYAQLLEQNLKEVDTTKYLDYLDVTYATLARYFHRKDANKELRYLLYSTTINKIIVARQKEAFSAILKYNNELVQLEEQNTSLAKANLFFKNNLFIVLVLLLLLVVVVVVVLRKYIRSRIKARDAVLEKQEMAQTVAKKHIELNNKQRIYLDDLKYLKADRNYVEFHTDDKKVVDRNLLRTVLEELPPNFVQVHRSYVINTNFIKASTGSHVILLPAIEIPISRTFKNKLKGVV